MKEGSNDPSFEEILITPPLLALLKIVVQYTRDADAFDELIG